MALRIPFSPPPHLVLPRRSRVSEADGTLRKRKGVVDLPSHLRLESQSGGGRARGIPLRAKIEAIQNSFTPDAFLSLFSSSRVQTLSARVCTATLPRSPQSFDGQATWTRASQRSASFSSSFPPLRNGTRSGRHVSLSGSPRRRPHRVLLGLWLPAREAHAQRDLW